MKAATLQVKVNAVKVEIALLELTAACARVEHGLRMLTTTAAIRRQIRREIRDKFRTMMSERFTDDLIEVGP